MTDKNTSKENNGKIYIAIDLKSFYASVECMERGLDPLTTNLVVADKSRTQKTICLAVSPSLKSFGIPGRPRLYQVEQQVKIANAKRRTKAPGRKFKEKTYDFNRLNEDPSLEIDYIVAPPQMAFYMEYSTRIYNIYLKYVAPEDIHVYSIDEVFIDATEYLKVYKMTPKQFVAAIIDDILKTTGITATAGIGTNLYLCKIAMDIVAKHTKPDERGVRVAQIDEISYRKLLWDHEPITDFWRVGKGYAKRLKALGIKTMGDIARCSLGKPSDFYNEDLLYKTFGINAELLIDHAWGYEPCTMKDIKEYKPQTNSISSGQVLQDGYEYEKAKLVAKEMIDLLVLDLVDKRLVTDQIVLTIGYDVENLRDFARRTRYFGEIVTDSYGRKVPKPAHGTINLENHTSSTHIIMDKSMKLFDKIVNKDLLVRRLTVVANHIIYERDVVEKNEPEQLNFFTDYKAIEEEKKIEKEELQKEKKMQQAMLDIKKKFGKNAILKGMNLQEGATAKDRNSQIGGHKA